MKATITKTALFVLLCLVATNVGAMNKMEEPNNQIACLVKIPTSQGLYQCTISLPQAISYLKIREALVKHVPVFCSNLQHCPYNLNNADSEHTDAAATMQIEGRIICTTRDVVQRDWWGWLFSSIKTLSEPKLERTVEIKETCYLDSINATRHLPNKKTTTYAFETMEVQNQSIPESITITLGKHQVCPELCAFTANLKKFAGEETCCKKDVTFAYRNGEQ